MPSTGFVKTSYKNVPSLFPLQYGSNGNEVLDLQQRLVSVGYDISPDELGRYGQGTRAAVESFQYHRGLEITGTCTSTTWNTLVEACYELGDRILYYTRPLMRGDDIADLQKKLSSLGFDIGKVDGIFGKNTANGVADFQANVGLHPDAICGYRTVAELNRLFFSRSGTELVAGIKDRERLRNSPKTLSSKKILIADSGGLGALVHAIKRQLGEGNATILDIGHPSGAVQASIANSANVDMCLSMTLVPNNDTSTIAYYSGHSYESPGGKRLAQLVVQHLKKYFDSIPIDCRGMSLPILRETQMTAVLCQIGSSCGIAESMPSYSNAISEAIAEWVVSPIDHTAHPIPQP